MPAKKWELIAPPPQDAVQHLARALNISNITAQLLIQRDIKEIPQAKAFLKSDLNNLVDPHLIPGVSQALKRIEQALMKNERILIYGDYDVDGVTSVVLMKRFFRLLGREIDIYIPHRLNEGYGLSIEAIDRIAKIGVNLIITVDCGISSVKEVAYARKLGMDIIVTDHHEIPEQLPDCIIVNPKLVKSSKSFDSYYLSGVGIAFKVCWSLMNTFSDIKKNSRVFHDFLMDTIALVTLGTIADVSPLIGENRTICAYGLDALRYTKIIGLNALIKHARLADSIIQAEHISFRLGPLINAAGRIGNSYTSVELLLSDSEQDVEKIINQLDGYNDERKTIVSKIFKEISKHIEEEYDLKNNPAIVLSNDKWHAGVLGIVASKIAEEFCRPTILISTEDGIGKGSGRSIPCFHLYEAINHCHDLMTSFGGHEYAAGIRIDCKNIPEFRQKLNDYAKNVLKPDDFVPSIQIDSNIDFQHITRKLVDEIKMLSPFGEGNAEPVFCSHNLELIGSPRLMPQTTLAHLSFFAKQNDRTFRVVAFNKGAQVNIFDKLKDKTFSLAYTIKMNRWNGEENIELELVDLKP